LTNDVDVVTINMKIKALNWVVCLLLLIMPDFQLWSQNIKSNNRTYLNQSLQNKEEVSGKTRETYDLLMKLAAQCRKSNPDSSLKYLNRAYQIVHSSGDRFHEAVVFFEIGRMYVDKLAYFTALEYKLKPII